MDFTMDRSGALKLGIVLLVLLMLILGIPLAMPMGTTACPECPGVGASSLAGMCVAILVGLLLLSWAAGCTLVGDRSRRRTWILAHPFERPPRSA
jgi:hypothetical protein